MSFSESSNDSDWNISYSMKKKKRKDSNEVLKSTTKPVKRNFCEKWLKLFSPWLTRSDDDPNLPFCRACQRPLGNNGYRLQRHEKTAKHLRNQEILLNEGEDAIRIRLNKRPTKKFESTEISALNIEECKTKFETELYFKQRHTTPKKYRNSLERDECESPYMYTKREYHVAPPSHSQYSYQQTLQHHQNLPPPQPTKDCFDMFFEAISATVKRLPPKLAAEVKSRVSQVIAEFELRAICEKEAQERAQSQSQSVITMPTQTTNVVTIDPVITTGTNVANTNAGH